MSQNTSKKGFGFYVVLLAALAALAAGIYFVVIHGTFGLDSTHNGNCYDPLITWLLIGGAVIAVGLTVLKRLRRPKADIAEIRLDAGKRRGGVFAQEFIVVHP